MQVDPIKPKLKPPGTERLKVKHHILLPTFAFKLNLRRYIKLRDGRVLMVWPCSLTLSNPC